MNIAYIYPEKLPSDKARSVSVINTACELAKIADVTLFCEEGSSKESCERAYALDLSRLKFKQTKKKFLFVKSNRIFNKNVLSGLSDMQIVYVRHLKCARAMIEHKAKKASTFKVVYEAHEVFFDTYEQDNPGKKGKIEELRKLEAFVYSKSDALVFSNQNVQKQINALFVRVAKKQAVIYNGTSFGEKLAQKDFSILSEAFYVGSLYEWKGVDSLIDAFAQIEDKRLNIIGDGERRAVLEAKCRQNNIQNVSFLGRFDSSQVRQTLLQQARLCIIPNGDLAQNKYSTPIKLFEYLSTTNVVVAPNMSTIVEIDPFGEFLYYFDQGCKDGLVETLKEVFSMPEESLRQKATSGYEAGLSFSWSARAARLQKFLEAVL